MIDIDKVKLHLRIDGSDEDSYLNLLIGAATEHVTNITSVPNDATAPFTYDMVCLLLIGHWFANREAVVAGSLTKVPYGVDALIQNLRNGKDLI